MIKQAVILCGNLVIFFVRTKTKITQQQATVAIMLTSSVKESNCFMYSEGSVFVKVIILAETNIKGALIKVQATMALAI
jgi:hypothetical protein